MGGTGAGHEATEVIALAAFVRLAISLALALAARPDAGEGVTGG